VCRYVCYTPVSNLMWSNCSLAVFNKLQVTENFTLQPYFYLMWKEKEKKKTPPPCINLCHCTAIK